MDRSCCLSVHSIELSTQLFHLVESLLSFDLLLTFSFLLAQFSEFDGDPDAVIVCPVFLVQESFLLLVLSVLVTCNDFLDPVLVQTLGWLGPPNKYSVLNFFGIITIYLDLNLNQMSQTDPVREICLAIGYLTEIAFEEKGGSNDPANRLSQINRIIQWAHHITADIQAERNLRLELEAEFERLRSMPSREELLTTIDLEIQSRMKELNVDITLGTQLLPKIMEVVDNHILALLQEIDALNLRIQNPSNAPQQFTAHMIESQTVVTSQAFSPSKQSQQLANELHFANQKIKELQGIISGLQGSHIRVVKELEEAKLKNTELVTQMKLSNSKIEEFERKIVQTGKLTTTASSTSVNDANIKIISELKSEKQVLVQKNNQLVQQLIDAQSQVEDLKKKLRNKQNIISPLREPIQSTVSSNPRVRELQTELIAKQQEISALKIDIKSWSDKTNELISSLMAANGELEKYKNKAQGAPNKHESEQMVSSANQRVEEVMRKYADANNRIAQLEQQLEKNYNKEHLNQRNEPKNVQLSSQLVQAQQKIEQLINQLAVSNNRITDLELDLQSRRTQPGGGNNAPGYQRKMESVSHELMVANRKVEEMMKMVANYQNSVIDLELDKQNLGFQLNDAKNKQQQYLDQLKVEKASVAALKEQITKMKEAYQEAARSNVRAIDVQIQNKTSGAPYVQKPSQEREAINMNEPVHLQIGEKSQSQREHGHRKIFDGKMRGSQTSSKKGAVV